MAGKVLRPPQLLTSRGKAPWEDYTNRKVKHVDPAKLEKLSWILLYGDVDFERANTCLKMM